MSRLFLLLASTAPMIPMVCDPPREPGPYACRALPEELDFGEVQSFTGFTQFVGLDNRDRPTLGPLADPFSARLTSRNTLAVAVDFSPRDAKFHVQELSVRLSPECEEQTIRLVGLGSGALETPSADLDFGATPRSATVERFVPLTNTRREPISVSGSSSGPHRIDVIPSQFMLQPAERREVLVRLTCLREGPVFDSLDFRAMEQTINFQVTGECLP